MLNPIHPYTWTHNDLWEWPAIVVVIADVVIVNVDDSDGDDGKERYELKLTTLYSFILSSSVL